MRTKYRRRLGIRPFACDLACKSEHQVYRKKKQYGCGQNIAAVCGRRNNQSRRGKHCEISRQRENPIAEPVGDICDRGAGETDQNDGGVAKPGDCDEDDADRKRQCGMSRHQRDQTDEQQRAEVEHDRAHEGAGGGAALGREKTRPNRNRDE